MILGILATVSPLASVFQVGFSEVLDAFFDLPVSYQQGKATDDSSKR